MRQLIKNIQYTLLGVLMLCTAAQAAETKYRVQSPDGRIQLSLTDHESQLSYSLSWKGRTVLRDSEISLFPESSLSIDASEIEAMDQIWKPIWGQHSLMKDHCRQLRLKMHAGDLQYELLCRAYNDGVAFRFVVPEQAGKNGADIEYITEYNPLPKAEYWAPRTGAHEAAGPFMLDQAKAGSRAVMPTVIETDDDRFIGILESDLYSAERFEASSLLVDPSTMRASSSELYTGSKKIAKHEIKYAGEEVITPWRVILVGEQVGDLVVSQMPLNLAAPCELDDTSWIKPGKCLWDWRVLGYEADGFTYGVNTESYKRFIDFAAKYDIEYFLADAKWITKATPGKIIPPADLDIDAVMAYAAEKGVDVQLYYDRRKAKILNDDRVFPYYRGLGATGIKYGFMKNKAYFTRDATRRAAANQLLVNYHDDPCAMTGIERTLPNAITREYCHAQQDCKRAFSPSSFLKMAFLNALSGPLDQANGIFGLNGVNRGNRKYAPEELESFNSTVASEAARVLVSFGGLTFLPDAPEEYEKKADLFEFLQKMPATWDDSLIINSSMAEYITTARRSGDEWFVGSVIDENGGTLEIPLDFLEKEVTYTVTYYEDAPDTHFVTNRESYQVRMGEVTRSDTVAAKMAPGGGHCMWIRPAPACKPTGE
ncbi:glycoside hydrolase family 97 protein [Pontiella agarivorans]|uniref:Glycoside hydrolase family 97 catalytic domain-containing protein n=1 Tax=Pontiella agarivorans TaxID=3038953 RepID=A0ABU5N0S0_9BACT|nr:glycoside hydrolase family 97 catalytic domain-containing protein [Pontiella agarivorans]MDZ8120036.1 glycoside hydrolase family 97 catalytic domain-containing protein [Pontiella agarivorans]